MTVKQGNPFLEKKRTVKLGNAQQDHVRCLEPSDRFGLACDMLAFLSLMGTGSCNVDVQL